MVTLVPGVQSGTCRAPPIGLGALGGVAGSEGGGPANWRLRSGNALLGSAPPHATLFRTHPPVPHNLLFPPRSAAYLSKPFVLHGQRPIKFQIWDTAGQEKYESLAPMYYRKAGAAIVMYDLTVASSFERLRDWVRELGENGPQDIVVACVGNKLDLTADGSAREVREDVARDFARSEGALYFEASARTGEGVTEIFEALAEEVTRRRPGALGAAAAAAEEEGRVDVAPRDAKPAGGAKKGCC